MKSAWPASSWLHTVFDHDRGFRSSPTDLRTIGEASGRRPQANRRAPADSRLSVGVGPVSTRCGRRNPQGIRPRAGRRGSGKTVLDAVITEGARRDEPGSVIAIFESARVSTRRPAPFDFDQETTESVASSNAPGDFSRALKTLFELTEAIHRQPGES